MQEEQKTETPAKANWRPVFIVSDGTAITAETLAHSVLTQFPNLSYDRERIPFIDTVEKAKQTAERINAVQHRTGVRPLVFSTFVDPVISRAFISSNEGFQIELFRSFVGPLEHELCMKSEHTIGATHKIRDEERYNKRIAAIDYTLSHDDGQTNRGLDQAEVTSFCRCATSYLVFPSNRNDCRKSETNAARALATPALRTVAKKSATPKR